MTYMTADVVRTWIHQSGGIKAKATQSSLSIDAWLDILSLKEGKPLMTLFMPYEAAKAYASAINTVNDREAIERFNGSTLSFTVSNNLVKDVDENVNTDR